MSKSSAVASGLGQIFRATRLCTSVAIRARGTCKTSRFELKASHAHQADAAGYSQMCNNVNQQSPLGHHSAGHRASSNEMNEQDRPPLLPDRCVQGRHLEDTKSHVSRPLRVGYVATESASSLCLPASRNMFQASRPGFPAFTAGLIPLRSFQAATLQINPSAQYDQLTVILGCCGVQLCHQRRFNVECFATPSSAV